MVKHQVASVSATNREPHIYGAMLFYQNKDNAKTPCQMYQTILEDWPTADVIVYSHDDVTVHDNGWKEDVLIHFDDPQVVAVGLGGATRLGHPDLYKRPYELRNMARGGYVSNQTDWEVHGHQLVGSKQVVVLDAFFMAVRRDFLLKVGGWPVDHLSHHCLDLWLACEAARHGKKTIAVGVNCTHHGGGTSTKKIYQDAKWLQGGNVGTDHTEPHRWLYQEYADVLPLSLD